MPERRNRLRGLVLASMLLALPAAGAEAQCRIALALAMDMSSSVDATEDRFQREGLARALTSPEVLDAMFAVPGAHVAIAVYEWSGRYQQVQVLDWTELRAPEDVAAAAEAIERSRRRHDEYPTALGYAIGHAGRVFASAPPCGARTLDVSGDGRNNDGFPPALAYANFPLDGVTVNGLVVVNEDGQLAAYFANQVIRGEGAFVIEARDYADFERAMRQKLVRELGVPMLGRLEVRPP